MLEAVLGPLDRHADEARHGRDQHHVRVHRLLDAEAAAGVGRRDHAQAVAGDVERAGHQRLQHERALEIRPDRVAVRVWLELRNYPVGLHRRGDRAGEAVVVLERAVGAREGAVRVAVLELALLRDVGAGLFEKQRRAGRDRIVKVRDAGQRLVVDFDQLQRVFGDIAVDRHDHGHRLAAVARLGGRADLEAHLGAHDARDDAGHLRDLRAGDHADHAGKLLCGAGVDAADAGMRVRRTQDRRVAHPGHRLEVVHEPAAAGQERCVFLAGEGLSDPARGRAVSRHCYRTLPVTARRRTGRSTRDGSGP